MRSLAKSWPVVLLAIAIGASSYAGPNDDTPDPTKPKSPTILGGTTAKISVTDMNLRAVGIDAQVKDDNRHVLHLQAVARKQKDVIKLNCINDKLVQIKAQMNIFDGIHSTLTGALTSGSDERYALFAEVIKAGENIKHLREESDVCAGEPELFKQESRNEVHHPLIPDDPATSDPFTQGVEPPGYASPFR